MDRVRGKMAVTAEDTWNWLLEVLVVDQSPKMDN